MADAALASATIPLTTAIATTRAIAVAVCTANLTALNTGCAVAAPHEGEHRCDYEKQGRRHFAHLADSVRALLAGHKRGRIASTRGRIAINDAYNSAKVQDRVLSLATRTHAVHPLYRGPPGLRARLGPVVHEHLPPCA